jgi:TM2 domain-containing membrane protein YozV
VTEPSRSAHLSAESESIVDAYRVMPSVQADEGTSAVPKKRLIRAIVGFLINVLGCPGLGSIIGGRVRVGVVQLLLFLLGIPLTLLVIGGPLILGAWVWGMVTGIQMILERPRQPPHAASPPAPSSTAAGDGR